MAEWLVEEGIGETRAACFDNDEIVEARLAWPDELAAGAIVEARLVSRQQHAGRGLAEIADGTRVLVDRLTRDATDGATVTLEITRPALREAGRGKLARARPTQAPPRPTLSRAPSLAPLLAEVLEREGHSVRRVLRFPGDDWDALIADAFSRAVDFPGGSLVLSPTPAMTLVDVDGDLDPRSLALAACTPVAGALRRLDIGGSIGIDFPTLAEKAHRREVDEALVAALSGWPHERTAMNGFGFVQLVARLDRPSILHRATFQRADTAARWLLRRAMALHGPGCIELAGHPALEAQLRPEWLAELQRRTACEVRFRPDAGLAIEAPHAQLIAR